MKKALVFPGQGSQVVGMRIELFKLFPELIKSADAILGYSIADLCLRDPNGLLHQTEYTQPDKTKRNVPLPELGMDSLMLMCIGNMMDKLNRAVQRLFDMTVDDLLAKLNRAQNGNQSIYP